MRAPKYIAAFVCLLLAFTLFQGWMWHWRPEPDWHPAWWQSHTWANAGFILSLPAMMPAVLFENLGATSDFLERAAIAFGFMLELGLTYVLVYFTTRFLVRRIFGFPARKAVVLHTPSL